MHMQHTVLASQTRMTRSCSDWRSLFQHRVCMGAQRISKPCLRTPYSERQATEQFELIVILGDGHPPVFHGLKGRQQYSSNHLRRKVIPEGLGITYEHGRGNEDVLRSKVLNKILQDARLTPWISIKPMGIHALNEALFLDVQARPKTRIRSQASYRLQKNERSSIQT